MNQRLVHGVINLTLVAIAVIGSYMIVVNRQAILDWWKLSQTKPSADIVALADATTLVGRGRDMFFVSEPQINDAQTFNQNCTDTGEESLVLGCYKAQKIYLYNVTDTRLAGVKEVTAAHEMLHAAYERLGDDRKKEVNALLQSQIDSMNDERLKGLIDLYNKHEPGELMNEMHSILGTEYRTLSGDLEDYYKQYFADRGKVVGLSEAYEKVFTESKARIAAYDAQLDTLKKQIDSNYSELDQRKQELTQESNHLDSLRSSDPTLYNQAVSGYNAKVRAFNALIGQTRSILEQYNKIVEERNAESAAQADLYKSLDSQLETVPAT